jgi:biopolymer transport protein ExbD
MARKKHFKDHGSGGVNLGIIITPFLDMSFQMLSFFIMIYHPSALEGHIPGNLAPPENIAKKGEKNVATKEIQESVPEEFLMEDLAGAVQVKVKAVPKGQVEGNDRREGTLTQIQVKQASDAAFQVIADIDNEIPQAISLLEKHLKGLGAEKGNIKIEGDGELRQMYVMMVYDACKKAGYTKVHFVPPAMLRPEPK